MAVFRVFTAKHTGRNSHLTKGLCRFLSNPLRHALAIRSYAVGPLVDASSSGRNMDVLYINKCKSMGRSRAQELCES